MWSSLIPVHLLSTQPVAHISSIPSTNPPAVCSIEHQSHIEQQDFGFYSLTLYGNRAPLSIHDFLISYRFHPMNSPCTQQWCVFRSLIIEYQGSHLVCKLLVFLSLVDFNLLKSLQTTCINDKFRLFLL